MLANDRAMTFSFLKSAYPWLIVGCGMLFYCFNYFLRVSPSVMQSELTQSFHITAYEFGLLTSAYYWAYTPMQIPAGMIYDKFGVRFVLCAASLIATMGLCLFISADTFRLAWAGRFLIGLGCAFAYIGILKLASVWLPPNRFAIVAGLATAFGMACGAMTQKYITHLEGIVSYQDALRPAIFAGIVLSILIILLIKDRPGNQINTANEMQTPVNLKQLLNALWIIVCNRQMWLIGIIGCLLYLPASVFLDAYCKEYLITVFQITSAQAVNVSGLTFFGWIISGPIIGAFSDKIKRRCMPLTITGFFAAALLCVVFYLPGILNLYGLYCIFFIIGFCCGAHPLCFPLGKENNPIQISGTAVAYTNMLIMLGGMIFPPIVGKLLNLHSTAVGANGLPIYSASDYTFALSVVPIGVALGIFLSLFLKETYCESQVDGLGDKPGKRVSKPYKLQPKV
jgi:MFS family permease